MLLKKSSNSLYYFCNFYVKNKSKRKPNLWYFLMDAKIEGELPRMAGRWKFHESPAGPSFHPCSCQRAPYLCICPPPPGVSFCARWVSIGLLSPERRISFSVKSPSSFEQSWSPPLSYPGSRCSFLVSHASPCVALCVGKFVFLHDI